MNKAKDYNSINWCEIFIDDHSSPTKTALAALGGGLEELKLLREITKELMNQSEQQKEHMMLLSAQVQSITHRLNCLSDKVSDQAVLIGTLVD